MEVVNVGKVKSLITKDGSEIREILSPRNSQIKNQSLAEARVKSGEETLEHCHKSSEEIYYILQGKGRMKIEDEIKEVKACDGIVILPGKRHKIRNTGEDDLIFLCYCAPSYSNEDTDMLK
jgi:mannose-6-phosphate isomerase-like protein (cupin superfamily)